MLLCDTIEYDINTYCQEMQYNLRYNLVVHNYDEKKALISLERFHIRPNLLVIDSTIFMKFEELEIPHQLTAKEWIENLAVKNDPLFINQNITKKSLIALKEKLKLKLTIKDF